MGLNHWEQSKAVDVLLDLCPAGHAAHNRVWNKGMHTAGPILRTTGPT